MKHYIVAPAINVENTVGFLDSLDPEIIKQRVILIDNTEHADIKAAVGGGVAVWHLPFRNIGVAASWNWGAVHALAHGATFVTLASTSMRLTPDGGRALCDIADFAADHDQWLYGFESLNGWHLITLGRKTFDEVGFFDEQFHPAYFEDNDYIHRMRLAGILEPADGDRSQRKIPWVPTLRYESMGDGLAIKSGVHADLDANRRRYIAKWGGPPGEELRVHIRQEDTGHGAVTRGMSFTESA